MIFDIRRMRRYGKALGRAGFDNAPPLRGDVWVRMASPTPLNRPALRRSPQNHSCLTNLTNATRRANSRHGNQCSGDYRHRVHRRSDIFTVLALPNDLKPWPPCLRIGHEKSARNEASVSGFFEGPTPSAAAEACASRQKRSCMDGRATGMKARCTCQSFTVPSCREMRQHQKNID
jgi:hypothetical protein